MPHRTWIGLIVMAVSEAATLARIEPFYTWNTPIAWTGYILFADGIVLQRRGNSWLSGSRPEFALLAASSVPLWLIFELYNSYALRNWHYEGLPDPLVLRYLGYAWSFATIWPAIFESGELIAVLRRQPAAESGRPRRGAQPLGTAGLLSIAAGAAMLVIPLVYPSPYLAAPVFLGFAFLLDPVNAALGEESILADARAGHYVRLTNLLLAGGLCGLLWEFWNYWAGAKWIYDVPILPQWRLFEMPLLGYGGFPAFAVECFTMYVALRRLVWRSAVRPISI